MGSNHTEKRKGRLISPTTPQTNLATQYLCQINDFPLPAHRRNYHDRP